jgi:hypothetical protein
MTELSPVTQAVLRAFRSRHTGQGCLVAALRAVADHLVPQEPPFSGGMRPGGTGALTLDEAQKFQRSSTRRHLLAIANELEAQH